MLDCVQTPPELGVRKVKQLCGEVLENLFKQRSNVRTQSLWEAHRRCRRRPRPPISRRARVPAGASPRAPRRPPAGSHAQTYEHKRVHAHTCTQDVRVHVQRSNQRGCNGSTEYPAKSGPGFALARSLQCETKPRIAPGIGAKYGGSWLGADR